MSTAYNDTDPRPALLIVDDNGPRRQALRRLCEGAGWFVQLVDRPEGAPPPIAERDLESIEREHIQRVLLAHGGNVSVAARILGLHRRTLQRKLRIVRGDGDARPTNVISLAVGSSGAR